MVTAKKVKIILVFLSFTSVFVHFVAQLCALLFKVTE